MDEYLNGVPLEIAQGETLDLPVYYIDDNQNPINLVGYTARMQARVTSEAENPPLFDLSTENGAIVIDGANGYIDVFIPKNISKEFPIGWTGVWDLWLYSADGEIQSKILEGTLTVKGRVTHE